MQFSIQKASLVPPLQTAARLATGKSSMQILKYVKFSLSQENLTIEASDLEVGYRAVVPASGKEYGELCLQAAVLSKIVQGLDSDELVFNEDGHKVTVKAGRSKYNLYSIPAEEFPSSIQTGPHVVEVDPGQLAAVLSAVRPAMATGEGRFNLAGVLLEAQEGRIRAVATDGHRLHLQDQPSELNWDGGRLIPSKGVNLMRELLLSASNEEKAKLSVEGTVIGLELAHESLTVRLVEAKYPDYLQVIPDEGQAQKYTLSRLALRDALKRASITASDRYAGVKLTFTGEEAVLSLENPELGDSREAVPCHNPDPENETAMGMNWHYLADVLSVMGSEEVDLHITDPSRPVLVKGPADEGFSAVVMPMQING